jgi:7-cyano-7-deazaguanine reductase
LTAVDPSAPEQSLLGKPVSYASAYDPSLLFPIPRGPKRVEIGLPASLLKDEASDVLPRLPFQGADVWNAYELSWLNSKGKPVVALARFTVPCESPNIVESKSVKLYLNSFHMSRFESAQAVRDALRRDLSAACGAGVGVSLVDADSFDNDRVEELSGLNLDRLDIECTQYTPAPEWLTIDMNRRDAGERDDVNEVLTSRLLKSNCLVTGQPDWGSVQISYSGAPIDQAGLLRYIVSLREHNEFHEQCVERIFMDIWTRCKPHRLSVYARYTRRGGVDINPFRTSSTEPLPGNVRTARQ